MIEKSAPSMSKEQDRRTSAQSRFSADGKRTPSQTQSGRSSAAAADSNVDLVGGGDGGVRGSAKSRGPPPPVEDLEGQLTNNKLKELERIFEDADEDGGGGLDMDEFRNAMRQAISQSLTDRELDIMFMKVDTNCDGTVDWDEYLSYMLLEYREKDTMNFMTKLKPFPKRLRLVPNMNRYQRHHDFIVKIGFLPNLAKSRNALYRPNEEVSGRYLTITKEGVLNVWSMELQHWRRFELETSRRNTWVTSMAVLPNVNMCAVATTSATITFYEFPATGFNRVLQISDLEICATCMDYWYDSTELHRALLLWGDARGNISMLEFHDCGHMCFLHPEMHRLRRTRLPFGELLKGTTCGVRATKLTRVHGDFVHDLRYSPSLEAFMSCSRDQDTALFIGDIELRRKSYFRVRKGVFTFDHSKSNNIIVTGGKDALVRVWNPYVTAKPVMLLQGHKSAVTSVLVNETKEQVISISETKDILIFDLSTQVCIQKIFKKWVTVGPRPVSATYFMGARQALLLATNQLAVLEHKEEDLRHLQLTSHIKAISHVLYNTLFDQVVSGGADSLVCVWNVHTGERVIQFVAHRKVAAGMEVDVEITAMQFDPTLRRLITALRDGVVKIWNFNNGAVLRVMEPSEQLEVTGIVCPAQRIITAGWNKRLTVYVDCGDDETKTDWQLQHNDDILSLAFYPPGIVASAAYDGDILVWSLETGRVTMRLNAQDGVKPFTTVENRGQAASRLDSEISLNASCQPSLESMDKLSENSASLTNIFPDMAMPEILAQTVTDHEKTTVDQYDSSLNDSSPCPPPNAPCPSILKKLRKTPEMPRSKVGTPLSDARTSTRSPLSPTRLLTKNVDVECGLSGMQSRMSEFPRHTPSSHLSGDSRKERSTVAIEKLLFLTARLTHKDTATLVASDAVGWVRAWSCHHEGGLLGQFNAAHKRGEAVLAMTTDRTNEYLVTGDSLGYIKVWDVSIYCIHMPTVMTRDRRSRYRIERYKQFPFLGIEPVLRRRIRDQRRHRPPPPESSPETTVHVPPLLNSFRGHLQSITSVDFISERQLLLSASSDCSIRMWSLGGQFVGIFGQQVPWPSSELTSNGPSKEKATAMAGKIQVENVVDKPLPADVRRVASATTLKVFYGGSRPLWKLAKNIIMIWVPMLLARKREQMHAEEMEKASSAEKWSVRAKAVRERMAQQGAEEAEAQVLAQAQAQAKVEAKAQAEAEAQAQVEVLEDTDEDIDHLRMPRMSPELTENENLLGKTFKTGRRHQSMPSIMKPKHFQTQVAVYSSLPCYDLCYVENDVKPPQTIVEIQERTRGTTSGPKSRTTRARNPTTSSVQLVNGDLLKARGRRLSAVAVAPNANANHHSIKRRSTATSPAAMDGPHLPPLEPSGSTTGMHRP